MAVSAPTPKLDRYIVIHVATTCDEHGVYVTKDSAEVIELGWILLDTKTCEEVRGIAYFISHSFSHCPSLSPLLLYKFPSLGCLSAVLPSSTETTPLPKRKSTMILSFADTISFLGLVAP